MPLSVSAHSNGLADKPNEDAIGLILSISAFLPKSEPIVASLCPQIILVPEWVTKSAPDCNGLEIKGAKVLSTPNEIAFDWQTSAILARLGTRANGLVMVSTKTILVWSVRQDFSDST